MREFCPETPAETGPLYFRNRPPPLPHHRWCAASAHAGRTLGWPDVIRSPRHAGRCDPTCGSRSGSRRPHCRCDLPLSFLLPCASGSYLHRIRTHPFFYRLASGGDSVRIRLRVQPDPVRHWPIAPPRPMAREPRGPRRALDDRRLAIFTRLESPADACSDRSGRVLAGRRHARVHTAT